MVIYITSALMVELVDTTDLKSVDLLVVRVQVPLKAFFSHVPPVREDNRCRGQPYIMVSEDKQFK